ncbi:hypothetical protein D3C85_874980 [compost metagenome]
MEVILALIQLRLAIEHGEDVVKVADSLGGAEKQDAARLECIVEQRNDLLLQFRAQIDQQIATTDQIQPGKRGVLDQILLGKDQHVADAFMNAIAASIGFQGEKPLQPFRADVGRHAGRINTGACRSNRLTVDISGEHLNPVILLEGFAVFLQENGQGIGLLAGRTAG